MNTGPTMSADENSTRHDSLGAHGPGARPPRRPLANEWTVFPEWSPDLRKARVYEQILLDVILGELPPGGRLDEQALALRYDAGLAGVREALGRLALEGLVARRARAGTTVAPLDLMEVRQAVEARRLIEPHCAALAARNATAEDIDRLRGAFDGAEAAVRARDARALVGMDQRFHAALARASRNLTLARILIPLQHKATRFWVYSMGPDTEDQRHAEIARHLAVVDCIAMRDPERASAAILRTLGEFSEDVRRAVNGPADESPLAPRLSLA
jgi:DNA-binding GntR family transcriptional regulator